MNVKGLTGLRWLAALLVFFSHNVPSPNTVPDPVFAFFAIGYNGVSVFFVLSGFVLCLNYLQVFEKPSKSEFLRFYLARIARIYPLYLFVLFVALSWQYLRNHALPEGFFAHIFATQAWSPDIFFITSINPPGLSISVELFFYLLFPFLILFFNNLLHNLYGALGICFLGVALMGFVLFVTNSAGAEKLKWIYYFPPSRLGDFLLGIGVAAVYLIVRKYKYSNTFGYVSVCIFGPLFIFLMCVPGLLFTPVSYDLLFAVPAAIIILGISLSDSAARGIKWLASPLMVLLGESSYAFYLIHFVLGQTIIGYPLQDGFNLRAITQTLFLLGFLIMCSVLLHLLIERPARMWINSLGRKTDSPPRINQSHL